MPPSRQAEFEPQTAPATELTVSGLILGDVRALPERSEAPECPELRWDEAAQARRFPFVPKPRVAFKKGVFSSFFC